MHLAYNNKASISVYCFHLGFLQRIWHFFGIASLFPFRQKRAEKLGINLNSTKQKRKVSQIYWFFSIYPSHGTRQETHLPVVVAEKLKLLVFFGGKSLSENRERKIEIARGEILLWQTKPNFWERFKVVMEINLKLSSNS